MADLSFSLRDPDLSDRLLACVDAEGKIPRAIEALGSVADRDTVLIDGGSGFRARQLLDLGARLTVVEPDGVGERLRIIPAERSDAVRVVTGTPTNTSLPEGSADVVVTLWSAFRGASPSEVAEADRILRPGGRLLVIHDYGRDDVGPLRGALSPSLFEWSRRDGWFLSNGFKIRVVHCWWTFQSVEAGTELVRAAFGPASEPVVATMRRPRLSYNVAVYHRARGGAEQAERSST